MVLKGSSLQEALKREVVEYIEYLVNEASKGGDAEYPNCLSVYACKGQESPLSLLIEMLKLAESL